MALLTERKRKQNKIYHSRALKQKKTLANSTTTTDSIKYATTTSTTAATSTTCIPITNEFKKKSRRKC